MKFYILFLLSLVLSNLATAQTMRDVVQLKNGSVIKGAITEQIPPVLKIKTADGSIFVYQYDEIEKISKEESQPTLKAAATAFVPKFEEYGTRFGIGIAIGSVGLIGLPVRYYITRKIAVETGVYLSPHFFTEDDYYYDSNGLEKGASTGSQFKMPAFVEGGFNFFAGEKVRPYSNKIVKNGLMLKAGSTIGAKFEVEAYSSPSLYYQNIGSQHYSQQILVLGWVRERFQPGNKRNSYNFQLGLGLMKHDGINSNLGQLLDEYMATQPFIYYKFHWNFFL